MENSVEEQPLVIEEIKFCPAEAQENGLESFPEQSTSAVIGEKNASLKNYFLWGSPGRKGAGFFESSTSLTKKEQKKPMSLGEYKWRNRYSTKRSSSGNIQTVSGHQKEEEKQSSRSSSFDRKEKIHKLQPSGVWKDRIKNILQAQRSSFDGLAGKNESTNIGNSSTIQSIFAHSKSNTSLKSKSFPAEEQNSQTVDAVRQMAPQTDKKMISDVPYKQPSDSSSEDELFGKGGFSRRSSMQGSAVKEAELRPQPTPGEVRCSENSNFS